MAEKRFYTPQGAAESAELTADHAAAEKFDRVRVGALGVYFREGLKERLRLLCSWLEFTGKAHIDNRGISIQFTRALPVNETEVAQLVSELRDIVPLDILLGLLPFVDDPESAAAEVRAQQGGFPNLPPELTDEQP